MIDGSLAHHKSSNNGGCLKAWSSYFFKLFQIKRDDTGLAWSDAGLKLMESGI